MLAQMDFKGWMQEHLAKAKATPGGVYATVIDVFPSLAEFLLSRNPDNRKIREMKLDQYTSDMKEGRWVLNGEPIIISEDGLVNDGQHRLQAVVKSGRSIQMFFAFGLKRESRFTVDVGAARTAGDHLGLQGYTNSTMAAAITRIILGYENRSDKNSLGRASNISPTAVTERVILDDLIREIASWTDTNRAKLKVFGPGSILGAMYYLFAQKKPGQARNFMNRLKEGHDLSMTDPIRQAREYLMTRDKLSNGNRMEVLIRAWNKWIEDEPMTRVTINGNIPEIRQ